MAIKEILIKEVALLGGEGESLILLGDNGLRHLVEDGLHPHRAVGELGKVATFQVLGDGIVESPERTAFEFLVARVAKLLDSFVDVTGRESLSINKLDN